MLRLRLILEEHLVLSHEPAFHRLTECLQAFVCPVLLLEDDKVLDQMVYPLMNHERQGCCEHGQVGFTIETQHACLSLQYDHFGAERRPNVDLMITHAATSPVQVE